MKPEDKLKEDKIRANVIRELREKHPKGFCYICGNASATIHHLREDKMGRRRGRVNGIIPLCRKCHNAIEEMKGFKKLKKAYNAGFQAGKQEALKEIKRLEKELCECNNAYDIAMKEISRLRFLLAKLKQEGK